MLQEWLLIFSCLNNTGCNETFNTYRHNNKILVQSVEEVGQEQLKKLNPVLRDYFLPVAAAGLGGTASFPITNSLSLSLNKEATKLVFTLPLN